LEAMQKALERKRKCGGGRQDKQEVREEEVAEEIREEEVLEEVAEDLEEVAEVQDLDRPGWISPTKLSAIERILDTLYVEVRAMSPREISDTLGGDHSEGFIRMILEEESDAVETASGKWWHRLHQPW